MAKQPHGNVAARPKYRHHQRSLTIVVREVDIGAVVKQDAGHVCGPGRDMKWCLRLNRSPDVDVGPELKQEPKMID